MPFINCKQCGKLNSAKLRKCPKCGATLFDEPAVAASPSRPAPAVQQPAAPYSPSAFGAPPPIPQAPPAIPTDSPFVAPAAQQPGIPRRRNPYYTGK